MFSSIIRSTIAKQSPAVSKRFMGTHAAKKDWTGVDAIARKYFPEDYQLAGAILSFYGVCIGISVLRSKLKKSPEPAPAPAATSAPVAASTEEMVPSVESPNFEKFINDEAALGKFIENEEMMMKWIDTLSKE